jgi:glycosyltransferase involved in cell wall biosynthesis
MTPATTPVRISVCMATYNGALYIEQQLRSILTQLSSEDEVVISDDSSSDRTVDLIQGIGDPRVRLLPGGKFRSPVYNMENALQKSRGAFIFLADQDDIWLDGKVSKMLMALQDSELVASDCKVVDSDLDLLHESYFRWIGARTGFLNTLVKTPYVGNCMAFRRSLLALALPFPTRLPMHDWWIALLAEYSGSTCLLREPLVLFRRHPETASSSFGRSRRPLLSKIADRVRLFRLVVSRHADKRRGD